MPNNWNKARKIKNRNFSLLKILSTEYQSNTVIPLDILSKFLDPLFVSFCKNGKMQLSTLYVRPENQNS